jgi:predicted ATPase
LRREPSQLHQSRPKLTGRDRTGKSTLADAIVMAFPPVKARILYNTAGGAKNTKERTRLTYADCTGCRFTGSRGRRSLWLVTCLPRIS